MTSRLFFSLLFAVGALATPLAIRDSPVTLPITRHYNFTRGVKIADSDRSRFRLLRDRHPVKVGHDSVFPVPATNAIVTYTTSVSVEHRLKYSSRYITEQSIRSDSVRPPRSVGLLSN